MNNCVYQPRSQADCGGTALFKHARLFYGYPTVLDWHGWSSIIAIHKDITFSFNLILSSKDIKVDNM